MSGIESRATTYHINTDHEFPIPSYSTEQPGIPLPETYDFLYTRDPEVVETLLPVFSDHYFQRNLVKLQRKLQTSEIRPETQMGLENALTGFMFEEAAYRYLRRGINDAVLLSPNETRILFENSDVKKSITERVRTVPDGIVIKPFNGKSVIVGSCEYTIRANLGSKKHPYNLMNRDKRKQLMQHVTGKVIYDLFTRQKPDVKKKLGEKLNNFYPDLPETIAYDRESFRAILANTDENDTPFTHEKLHHIRLPLTSNDLMYISMSLMTELQNSPAFYDTRKPNPYQSIAAD